MTFEELQIKAEERCKELEKDYGLYTTFWLDGFNTCEEIGKDNAFHYFSLLKINEKQYKDLQELYKNECKKNELLEQEIKVLKGLCINEK